MSEQPADYRELQLLLDRHASGDPAACELLVEWADRWQRSRSGEMLRGFAGVARWEGADDVHNEALRRLNEALKTERPATASDFLGLLGWQIKKQLIDFYRHYFGPEGLGKHYRSPPKTGTEAGIIPDHWLEGLSSDDPARRAQAAERMAQFNEKIDELPEAERQVVLLRFYDGLEEVEVAGLLGVSRSTVARAWVRARLTLAGFMEGLEGDSET